jgi:hypothetical protein
MSGDIAAGGDDELTPGEASARYGVPISTLYDRARRHPGLARKVFGRVRISRPMLERLLQGQPLAMNSAPSSRARNLAR